MTASEIRVAPQQVRRSAAEADTVADRAGTSRDDVADGIAGFSSGWQSAGRPGFGNFIGILQTQADRLRADLGGLADDLRAAADTYESQEQTTAAVVDSLAPPPV